MTHVQDWIGPALVLFTAVYGWFKHKDTKPTDAERAALLTQLAEDAAAVVLAAFPGKPWAEYVNMIVQRLLALPGVPTKNAAALESAANAAILKVSPAIRGVPVGK